MSGSNQLRIYCAGCKETHNLGVFDDIWFRYPDAQLEIPFAEYAGRIRFLKDFCTIDNTRYLLRGWLQIPIIGWQRPHVWGCWAEVDEPTYRRCFELRLHEEQSGEPLFVGIVATNLPGYLTQTRGLPVNIRLHRPGTLPEFIVIMQGTDADNSTPEKRESNKYEPGSLAYQQRLGVLPRDMIQWFHACM